MTQCDPWQIGTVEEAREAEEDEKIFFLLNKVAKMVKMKTSRVQEQTTTIAMKSLQEQMERLFPTLFALVVTFMDIVETCACMVHEQLLLPCTWATRLHKKIFLRHQKVGHF